MKVLCVSDLHLDWVTAGVPRFDEVRGALRAAVTYAVEKLDEGDLFVCCGDVCDPDSGPVVLRVAAALIEEAQRLEAAGIVQLWVAGNHDAVLDGRGHTTLEPLAALGTAIVAQGPVGSIPVGPPELDAWIVALPYPGAVRYDPGEYLRQERRNHPRGKLLVFSHLVVPGLLQGEEGHEMARGKDVLFPVEAAREVRPELVVQGHHHARQVVELGGGLTIHVVGSAARLRFGPEEGNPDPAFLVFSLGAR
jgi:DNA repair exonuclease SbcCD nuclease subunit